MNPLTFSRLSSASFYHLANTTLEGCACQGLACFAARNDAPERWGSARQQTPPIYCLGQCYRAPATFGDEAPASIGLHCPAAVLTENLMQGAMRDINTYQQGGGGQALQKALSSPAKLLVKNILVSGLRGRGGAGFSTGIKWQAVAQAGASAEKKYLVVNADEGDAGSFSDRLLLENDPFRLIEACVIAAHACGISQGFIYLRKEYATARAILENALLQAKNSGWLGAGIFGSNLDFELSIHIGQGSYVCGEETSLLNSLEGRRPEVRQRPPQITEQGLHGAPTLVNNVETLCAVPWIINNGGKAYAAMGINKSRGTKLLSLNSLFNRPGLYEVEFGISLRDIIEKLGGGLRRGHLKGLMIGGPLAGIIPPALFDAKLGYEELQGIGAALGHGGVIAFADDSSIVDIMTEVFRFSAEESCGKCTPCHLGSAELAHSFNTIKNGGKISSARWQALIGALEATSLCGHGRGMAEFARSIERYYAEELAQCFES